MNGTDLFHILLARRKITDERYAVERMGVTRQSVSGRNQRDTWRITELLRFCEENGMRIVITDAADPMQSIIFDSKNKKK